MLNVHNLTVSFMGSDLFSGITFKLNKGDRIGLIGKNGAGKSTLLKVLSKDIESSAGTMAFDKDIQIGFLRQDIDFVQGRTILEEAYQAFEEIKEKTGKKKLHIWKTGDRYYKLAAAYYGRPQLWWVIALYNQKPTEGHLKIGDVIKIPTSLDLLLYYL